ncbi:hypothetical protein PI125_g21288 [Phytophthora idaei]|nr:hypothetical protein PI125_g21288 [Phytophthora idaei]
MATSVHAFISGISAVYQRFYLTRQIPSAVVETFAVALREDYSVTASQAFEVTWAPAPASEPEPEPMEIDISRQNDARGGATSSPPRPRSSPLGSAPYQLDDPNCPST